MAERVPPITVVGGRSMVGLRQAGHGKSAHLHTMVGGGIQDLQRAVGNSAVSAMLQRSVEPIGNPGSRPNLDIGDSGPAVGLLQNLLGLRQTEQFDAATGAAVKKFQQNHEAPSLHPATGGVGPLTWRALDER